jgi:hypothetical protein
MSTTYVTYETGSDTIEEIDISTITASVPIKPKRMVKATTAISEEVSKTAKPTGKPQYMVSVDGHTAPMMVHSTIEAARKEAERLHSTGSANGHTVRVLLVVGTYKPTYTWEDWL